MDYQKIGEKRAEELLEEMCRASKRHIPHDMGIYRGMFLSFVAPLPKVLLPHVRAYLAQTGDLLTRGEVMVMREKLCGILPELSAAACSDATVSQMQ